MRYSKIGKFVAATLKKQTRRVKRNGVFCCKVVFYILLYPNFIRIVVPGFYSFIFRIFIRVLCEYLSEFQPRLFCIILAKRDADALYKHVDCKLHLVKGRNGRRDADVAVVVVSAVREG